MNTRTSPRNQDRLYKALGRSTKPPITPERKAELKAARLEKEAEWTASKARMEAGRAETRKVVADGKCPMCQSSLRRNSSLTGWWQCEQVGAETHRARPQDPHCSWQGFTE